MAEPSLLSAHEAIKVMTSLAEKTLFPTEEETRINEDATLLDGLACGPTGNDPRWGRGTPTARILDALAQVLLSTGDGEVYAAAVAVPKVTFGDQSIKFIFASNTAAKDGTKQYMEKLLKLLRELAIAVRKDRPNFNSLDESPVKEGQQKSDAVKACEVDVFDHILARTIGKIYRRLRKRRAYLNDLKDALSKPRFSEAASYEELQRFVHGADSLYRILDEVEDANKALGKNKIKRALPVVLKYTAMAAAKLKTTRKDLPQAVLTFLNGNCHNMKPASAEGSSPARPTRTRDSVIQKVALIPHSALSLISWAMLPRHRQSLERKFEVEFITGGTTIALSQDKIMTADNHILELSTIATESMRQAIADSKDRTSSRLACHSPIHAEVAIILHAAESPPSLLTHTLCSYVGVSKLSCFSCNSFLRNYSYVTHQAWTTRGCNHKLYTWGILTGSDMPFDRCDVVLAMVEKDVRAAFAARCRETYGNNEGQATSKSDSSAASDERVFDHIEPEELDQLMTDFN